MSNVFDHMHIKRHTAGSSNELSFDVLDAARDGYVPKKKRFGKRGGPQVLRPVRQDTASQAPVETLAEPLPEARPVPEELPAQRIDVVSQADAVRPSFHRAVGKSDLSSQKEVTSRKRRRRTRTIVASVVASVVAVVVMVATAYVGYQHYVEMQRFQDKFDSLVQLFVEADEVLPLADSFMADPFGASVEQMEELQQAAALANVTLQQLADERALALSYTVTEQDEQALFQVEQAVADRQAMMDATLRAVEVVGESEVDSSEISALWLKVLGADEQARAAASAANAADSDEAIASVREKTVAARDQLQQILDEMQALGQSRPDLDLSGHIAYLKKRIESLDHAIATGDALLKADRALAASENEAYNVADQQAAELAEQLPLSTDQTVELSYEEEVLACKAEYDAARDKAIQSDLLIRQYLRR